jgi:hypothetical protein
VESEDYFDKLTDEYVKYYIPTKHEKNYKLCDFKGYALNISV